MESMHSLQRCSVPLASKEIHKQYFMCPSIVRAVSQLEMLLSMALALILKAEGTAI